MAIRAPWHLTVLAVLTAMIFPTAASANILLSDDFNDNSLDTAKWTTNTSANNAACAEMNAQMVLANRAYLVTKNEYAPEALGGIKISGQWTFVSAMDTFQLVTRSDATPTGNYYETANGLEFKYWYNGGAKIVADGSNLSIGSVSTVGSLSVAANQTFDFTVIDSGTKGVSLTLTQVGNAANTVTVTSKLISDNTTSDYIVFHNREYGSGTNYYAKLDNVAINTVPEPSTIALAVTGLIGLLAYAWRKRK